MAQRPIPATPATLIQVDNGNPGAGHRPPSRGSVRGLSRTVLLQRHLPAGLPDAFLEESISGAPRAMHVPSSIARRRSSSVYYASDMEPRIAAWRPGLGCTQLPIGATAAWSRICRACRMPVSVPSFDDRMWPMGDADATARLSKAKSAAVADVLDEAFKNDAGIYRGQTWGVLVVRTAASSPSATSPVGTAHGRAYELDVQERRRVARRYWRAHGSRGSAPEGATQSLADAWRPARQHHAERLLHMASGLYTDAGGDPLLDTTTPARRRPRSRC